MRQKCALFFFLSIWHWFGIKGIQFKNGTTFVKDDLDNIENPIVKNKMSTPNNIWKSLSPAKFGGLTLLLCSVGIQFLIYKWCIFFSLRDAKYLKVEKWRIVSLIFLSRIVNKCWWVIHSWIQTTSLKSLQGSYKAKENVSKNTAR